MSSNIGRGRKRSAVLSSASSSIKPVIDERDDGFSVNQVITIAATSIRDHDYAYHPFKCRHKLNMDSPICEELFITKEELEKHIVEEHFERFPYICAMCDNARFSTQYSIEGHIREKHDASCFQYKVHCDCNKDGHYASVLADLLKLKLLNSTCQKYQERFSNAFYCWLCKEQDVNFTTENDLEAHIALMHFNCLPYGCGICQHSRFPTKHDIEHHMSSIHNLQKFEYDFHGGENSRHRLDVSYILAKSIIYTKAKFSVNIKTLTGKSIRILAEGLNSCGGDYSVDLSPLTTTEQLKKMVQQKEGISLEAQVLVFDGKKLEHGRRLIDYNIKNGSTLHLTLPQCGGC